MAVRQLSKSTVAQGLPRGSKFWDQLSFFGDYQNIATATGTGSSNEITFSSIPSIYSHLQIRYIGLTASTADIVMKINSTTKGLRTHSFVGNGSATSSSTNTVSTNGLFIGDFGFTSTNPTIGIIDLLEYSDTNKYKIMRSLGGRDANGSGRMYLYSGLFDTTDVISSITFTAQTANFTTETHFALYGIRG